jgi:hypothetical protein
MKDRYDTEFCDKTSGYRLIWHGICFGCRNSLGSNPSIPTTSVHSLMDIKHRATNAEMGVQLPLDGPPFLKELGTKLMNTYAGDARKERAPAP